ncbi:MAG TPA: hypothetical protein VEC60_07490 [Reyranella sp.]|nr:hypothetical protein [Reyranella sp.]
MKMSLWLTGVAAALMLPAMAVHADPWKDESGKGKRYGTYRSYEPYYPTYDHDRRGYRESARIPSGHLPPPGECRTWYPNLPAGHQPPPYKC